jgi:hypothetical protein
MSKSFNINGELITSSGQKLKKVGYLMIGYIVLYVFNFLVTINSTDIEVIQFMSVLTLVVSIILTIMIIQNIIESGTGLIKSVQKEGIHEGYYPNGKLSYKGTYKFGKKDGTWEVYNELGNLVKKGIFVDDKPFGLWDIYQDDGQVKEKREIQEWEINVYD